MVKEQRLNAIATKLLAFISIIILTISLSVSTVFAASPYEDYIANGAFNSAAPEEVIMDVITNGTNYGFSKSDIEKINSEYELYKQDKENNQKSLIYAGNKIASHAKKQYTKSTIEDMGVDFNVRANTEQAGVALSGVQELVSVIVGILCYAITLGMTLFTALDLCYITMPVFRNKCEEMKSSGSSAMTKTDSKTGETKFRWVTDEAIYAVESCSIETGRQPLGVYLKKRVWAYVLLAIVLFILFTGNIQLIANIAVNFIAGLMDALTNLGA